LPDVPAPDPVVPLLIGCPPLDPHAAVPNISEVTNTTIVEA
jgi:hypothetical protein